MEKWTTFMRRVEMLPRLPAAGGVARMCLATLALAQKMRDRKKKESGRR
jgi:hypothetical protein